MRFPVARLCFAAALGLLAVPSLPSLVPQAQAQSIEIGPGGVRVSPERDYRRGPPDRDFRRGPRRGISEREAVRIARRVGLDEVNRVVDAGRVWRVSGLNRRGRFMRVVIDARSGDVIDVMRGRS